MRAKKQTIVLSMLLSRVATHPRFCKTLKVSANRVAHYVELSRVEHVDDDVRGWLTESFLDSPP